MAVTILAADILAADIATTVLAAEDISGAILVEDILAGNISAADMTIFEADITPAITVVGPDGALATMVTLEIMATGFPVTAFGNGILFMQDG